jgi:hypothetical protein
MKHQWFSSIGMIAGLALLLWSGPAAAAPSADLWERWQAHDESSTDSVDHTIWNTLLAKYVVFGEDGINRLAYSWIIGSEKEDLDRYLSELSQVAVSTLNRDEQRAYWINLYNALTVNVILNARKVRSIRDIDISPGFFSNGPWGKELITVEGHNITLDDIEHRILRPIWKDPRIHYALNCAALGCPNLWAVAVTVENTEEYLNFGATAFINHPRGSRVENGRAVVSSIYKWFSEDFGGSDETLMTHLKTYASPELAAQLDGATTVSYDSYDWTLNSVAVPSIKAFSTGNSRGS